MFIALVCVSSFVFFDKAPISPSRSVEISNPTHGGNRIDRCAQINNISKCSDNGRVIVAQEFCHEQGYGSLIEKSVAGAKGMADHFEITMQPGRILNRTWQNLQTSEVFSSITCAK